MPPTTPRTRLLSGAGVVLSYRVSCGEAIRVARLLQPVGNEGGIIGMAGDLCRRDAAVPSLSGGQLLFFPDPQAAGIHPVLVGWLLRRILRPRVNFVINGTPRTGSVNAAAGTAAMVGNTLVNRMLNRYIDRLRGILPAGTLQRRCFSPVLKRRWRC